MIKKNARLIWIIFGAVMLAAIGLGILLRTITPDSENQSSDLSSLLNTTTVTPESDPTLTQPAPSHAPLQVPDTPTITISGIPVQNFLSTSQSVDSQGTVSLREDENFSVLYFPSQQQFLISVLGSPFETHRQQAETFLLAALNIPEEEACRLTVEITTPAFANPNQAGKAFGLSFCR